MGYFTSSSVLLSLAFSVLAGVLYRLGGAKGWNTKFRDFGVPLVGLLTVLFAVNIKVNPLIHFLAFGAYFGALTTYWDSVFGYDNFYAHGFGCAAAYIFYAWATGAWVAFLIRLIICTLLVGLWSKLWKWDVAEEWGRGFILNASLFIPS